MLLNLFNEKRQRLAKSALAFRTFDFPNKNGTKLRVMSYNIFLRPPFVNNNGNDFKNERFREFLKEIDQFDVIALQELFPLGNTRPSYLVKYAHKLGFHWHARSVRPWPFQKNFLDAGLLILSKYPIVERDYRIYKHGHQVDSWVAKQAIYAKIQVSSTQYFHIFTTHMQASYYDSSDYHNFHNDRCRLKQVEEIADFIHEKTHNSPYPALITGDFNVNAKNIDGTASPEYDFLIKKLNRDTESCSKDHLPVRDLLKEHNNGSHPNTYADTHPEDFKKPRETILTHKADLCTQLCIDYMMF
jgi:sphingomyelin phosphodiesterase